MALQAFKDAESWHVDFKESRLICDVDRTISSREPGADSDLAIEYTELPCAFRTQLETDPGHLLIKVPAPSEWYAKRERWNPRRSLPVASFRTSDRKHAGAAHVNITLRDEAT